MNSLLKMFVFSKKLANVSLQMVKGIHGSIKQ